MQTIINFFLMLALPSLIAYSSASSSAEMRENQYCNTRFNFCIEYPSQVFTSGFEADNSDGVRLYSADKDVSLEISGSYNVLNWSQEEAYFFYVEQLKEQHPNVRELSNKSGSNYFESVFKVGDKLEYYKVVIQDDAYITLILTVNEGMQEMLNAIRDEVRITTNI